MNIDWFIVGVILAVVVLIGLVYRYHTKGAAEIKPSSFVTEALSGLEAPKSVDPEDDPLGQLQPMLDTLHFNYPERENYIKVKKEHGDSKQTEKALFERALGCVAKIIHMQKCFPILQNARQGNILPDELWELTQNKMKEIDDEYQDIRKEADSMVQNGGATIFQQASMIFNQIQQQQMAHMRQQQQQLQQQQPQQQGAKQVEDKKPGETKPVENQKEKEKEKEKPKPPDAKTIEQQKAAAEKAYKELLKEEANSGKKSKKSKKDE